MIKHVIATVGAIFLCLAFSLRVFAQTAPTYGPYASYETYALYLPAATPIAGIVLAHGGGWAQAANSNTASEIGYLAKQLAANGIAVMSIQYRPAPEVAWPGMLLDLQMAIRSAQVLWPGLPIGVAGASAGGQMALRACESETIIAPAVDPLNEATLLPTISSRPAWCISVSAPTDLQALLNSQPPLPTEVTVPITTLVGGSPLPNPLQDASPADQVPVGTLLPPIFLMHGNADPLIPSSQATEMLGELQGASQQNDQLVLTPGKHVFGGLTRAQINGYIGQMVEFILGVCPTCS